MQQEHEDGSKPLDWRARLHSLPSGTHPAPPAFVWFFRALLAGVLFLGGSCLTMLFGGIAGLALGIGPEQTGGALYVLLGLVINLVVGGAVAALIARRSRSRVVPRLVFYSFNAPAFLVVLLFAYQFSLTLFE